MAGETSVDEERLLYRYFTTTESIPASLTTFKDMFRALALFDTRDDVMTEMLHQTPENESEKKQSRKSMPFRWIAYTIASAAALILVWLSPVGNPRHSGIDSIYEGSYVMIDNKIIDDQKVLAQKISETLAWAETIEQEAESIPSTTDTETSILKGVSDPATRHELEKLLTD